MSWLPTMEEQGAAAAIERLLEKGIPFNRAPLEPKPNDERAKAKEPEEEIEEISSTSQEESTDTLTPDSQYFGRVRIEGDYTIQYDEDGEICAMWETKDTIDEAIQSMWETVEEPKEKQQKETNRDSSQQENEMQKRKTAELGPGQLLKRAIHAASAQPKPRAHPKAVAATKAVPPFSK